MKYSFLVTKQELKGIKPAKVVTALKHAKQDEISEVTEITSEIKQQIMQLTATAETLDGLGMAAPQIGILKRFFVGKTETGDFQAIFNPKYEPTTEAIRETAHEGCLSVQVCTLPVSRWNRIHAHWTAFKINENGDCEPIQISEDLEGLKARIFQHETDHCDGRTILEISNLNRKVKRDIEKALLKLK